MDIKISISSPLYPPSPPPLADTWIKGVGLGDTECNDPLDYYPYPYMARCTKSGIPVPEVRKMENGDGTSLFESWERTWYIAFRLRNLHLSEDVIKNQWRVFMKGDRAFTNKFGSDTKHSWVLGTNVNSEPMRAEGVDCPNDNIYRIVEVTNPLPIKNGRECYPIWVLDYDYPPKIDSGYASIIDFAKYLPEWTLHTARIINPPTEEYPKGYTTDFDYNFPILLMTSVGKQSVIDVPVIIDGKNVIKQYHVRQNYMRASRIKLL